MKLSPRGILSFASTSAHSEAYQLKMRNPESSNTMLVLVTGRTRKTASARLWNQGEGHLVPVSI
jgi:hypothetical protein